MRACSLLVVVSLITCSVTRANADDCNPTYGDQFYNWVSSSAAPLSYQLASSDYRARILNFMLVSADQLHSTIQDSDTDLQNISDRLNTFDSGDKNAGDKNAGVASDIGLETDAQDLLNTIFNARVKIDNGRRIMALLRHTLTLDEFKILRLNEVGRGTLYGSIQDLGNTGSATLQAKYSFYVGVSFDEDGNATGTQIGDDQSWVDTTLMAISYTYPYVWFVYAAYEIGKLLVKEHECQEKVAHQQNRVKAALALLPTKLMGIDDLFSLYSTTYANSLRLFQEDLGQSDAAIDLLDSRWKQLLAFDLARHHTASSMLTADKVTELRQQYGHDDAVTLIFDNVAITQLASDIGAQNAYLARKHRALLLSCGNLDGYLAGEDDADALRTSDAAYTAFLNHDALLPLYGLLGQSQDRIRSWQQEAQATTLALKGRDCKKALLVDAAALVVPNVEQVISLVPAAAKRSIQAQQSYASKSHIGRNLPSTVVGHLAIQSMIGDAIQFVEAPSMCVLASADGGTYACNTGGKPYSDQFSQSFGDPERDILLGPKDGGYAQDNRQASLDINQADSNLKRRITDLSNQASKVEAALPQWRANNDKFLSSKLEAGQQALADASKARSDFEASHAAALADSTKLIDNFLSSPVQPNRVEQFISALGGSDFSLPALPVDAVVPDAPSLAGISASQRAYPESLSQTSRYLVREGRKVDMELEDDSAMKALAGRELQAAEKFAKNGGVQSDLLADALRKDSASLRFAHSGLLPHPSVTISTSDGILSRSDVAPAAPLLSDSLLSRVQSFEVDAAIFNAKLETAQSATIPGSDSYERQRRVTGAAERAANDAVDVFYSGNLVQGEYLLSIAITSLDLATTFIPTLNAARSAYQVITGRDLITGEQLSSIQIGLCILDLAALGGFATVEEAVAVLKETRAGQTVNNVLAGALDTISSSFPKTVVDELLGSTRTGIVQMEAGTIRAEKAEILSNALPSDQIYARVLPGKAATALQAGDADVRLALKNDQYLIENDFVSKQYAFVSAAEDLRPITSRPEMAQALKRYDGAGKLIEVGEDEVVMEFKFVRADDPTGLVSPIGKDWGPGFIPGGRVEGGKIREWVVPNSAVQDGLIDIRSIQIRPLSP
jgi:hypothetical protein